MKIQKIRMRDSEKGPDSEKAIKSQSNKVLQVWCAERGWKKKKKRK